MPDIEDLPLPPLPPPPSSPPPARHPSPLPSPLAWEAPFQDILGEGSSESSPAPRSSPPSGRTPLLLAARFCRSKTKEIQIRKVHGLRGSHHGGICMWNICPLEPYAN